MQTALQVARERKTEEKTIRVDDRLRSCAELLDRIQHEMEASDDPDVVWLSWNVRYVRDTIRGALVLLED